MIVAALLLCAWNKRPVDTNVEFLHDCDLALLTLFVPPISRPRGIHLRTTRREMSQPTKGGEAGMLRRLLSKLLSDAVL
jgi:hypothetical protein